MIRQGQPDLGSVSIKAQGQHQSFFRVVLMRSDHKLPFFFERNIDAGLPEAFALTQDRLKGDQIINVMQCMSAPIENAF